MMNWEQAVDNVLNGQTALGEEFAGASVPFTKDEYARKALAMACEQLGDDIKDSLALDDDEAVTAFIAKVAVYCTKQGWKTNDGVTLGLAFLRADIADALREEPESLTSKAGIAGILKKHHRRAVQDSAALKKQRANDNDRAPEEKYRVGNHVLYELFSPAHLKDESRALSHCIGTSYNAHLLKQRGLQRADPGAEFCLTYAVKIRNRQSRIFSLRTSAGRSLATVEYDVHERRIKQLQGNPIRIPRRAPFFADLCEALYQLSKDVDLSGGISELPDPNKVNPFYASGALLLRTGKYHRYRSDMDLGDVLSGKVRVRETMSATELVKLAECANITLDITGCSNEWLNKALPATVKAHLFTNAKTPLLLNHVETLGVVTANCASQIAFPKVTQAGHIESYAACHVAMPILEKIGHLNAACAAALSLPCLTQAGNINASQAKNFTMPKLQKCGDLKVFKARDLILPALQRSGDIAASNAQRVFLPLLENAQNINASCVNDLTLPQLQYSGDIVINNLPLLELPNLQRAGCIRTRNVKTLNMPKLKKMGELETATTQNVILPLLEKASHMAMNNAEFINLSHLREVGHMNAGNAMLLDLPSLEKAEGLSLNRVRRLLLPKLETCGDLHASTAKRIEMPLLQQSGNLSLGNAAAISCPALRKARDITADEALSIDMPNLEWAMIIKANNAQTVSLPCLGRVRYVFAEKATDLHVPSVISERVIQDAEAARQARLNDLYAHRRSGFSPR